MIGPDHEALLTDSVGLALLVELDTMNTAERLSFVLHDLFAVPFDVIAPIVERSPRTPPGARSGGGSRRRSHSPARSGRGIPRCLPRR
jgi:hypothetical protein